MNKGISFVGPLLAGLVAGAAGVVTTGAVVGLIVGIAVFTLLVVLRLARRPA